MGENDIIETTDGFRNREITQWKTENIKGIPHFTVSNSIDVKNMHNLYYDQLLRECNFAAPKVVISIYGADIPLNSDKYHQTFKQMLIDVFKLTTMWIITSGNNCGVNELVSEAVEENRQDYILDKTILLGIKLDENDKSKLDVNDIYNGYLFYKNETNLDNDSENVRSKFETFLKKTIHTVYILYDGYFDTFKPCYNQPKDYISVVLIKNSNVQDDRLYHMLKKKILRSNSDGVELQIKIEEYSIGNETTKLQEKILQALISNEESSSIFNEVSYTTPKKSSKNKFQSFRDDWTNFELTCIFNENKLNVDEYLGHSINKDQNKSRIANMLFTVLKNNKARALKCLLKAINTTDDYVDENDLILLYKDSIEGNVNGSKLLGEKYKNMIGKNSKNTKRATPEAGNLMENIEMENNEMKCKNGIKIELLFIWALLSDYTEIAFVLWTFSNDFIGTALRGVITLNKLKDYYENRGLNCIAKRFSKESKKYEKLAQDIIEKAYEKSPIRAISLINRPLARWGNKSCLEISVIKGLKAFCNKSACQRYAHLAWWGKKLQNNSGKINEIESFNERFKRIIFSPIGKYWVYWLFYLIFIVLFICVNLVCLKPISEVKLKSELVYEILVSLYVFGLLVEEIKEILYENGSTFCSRWRRHFKIFWNKFDILIIPLFLVSVICRFSIHKDNFVISRCLNGVTMSLFILRSLQVFDIIPQIGPKVIMIIKMFKQLLFFLCLFILFILAYGTLFQSIKNPNRKFDMSLLVDIFFYPYFQVYGELEIDKFEIPLICNGTNCRIKYATIMISFAIFLLLTHILLINLLIAIFGQTFNKVQDEVDTYFAFNNIVLLNEFSQKPIFPPPFNMVSYVYFIIKFAIKKVRRKNNHLPEDEKPKYNDKILNEFEENIMKSIEVKHSLKSTNSTFI